MGVARAEGRGHNGEPRLWRSPEVGVATAEVGVATTQHLNRAEQEVGVATAKGAWPRRST